jgi:amino acid permease
MILLIFCVFVLYDIAIHLAKENLFSLTGDELKKSKVSALFPYFLRVFTKISIFLDDKISFKKNEKKTIRKRKFFPDIKNGKNREI